MLVQGHDVHSLLAITAKRAWGATARVGREYVADLLRAAFSCRELMSTSLYQEARAWARINGTVVWGCPDCQ